MELSCLPLLAPSAPLSIVHSSTFPKGWTSLRTSSSLCCLLNMPTKSLRSSAKEGREDMVIMGFRMIPFMVTGCANEEGFTRFSMMKIVIWALGSKDITCRRDTNSQEREWREMGNCGNSKSAVLAVTSSYYALPPFPPSPQLQPPLPSPLAFAFPLFFAT